eukprot:802504-Alexandrium_andersonii.AAC.1
MSASLVGSEMCIRDSPSTAERALAAAIGRRPPQRARGRHRSVYNGGSVSYTHLTLPTICSV